MRMTPEDLAAYEERRKAWNKQHTQGDDQPDPGPESRLQAKCEQWLRSHGWAYYHDRSRGKNQAGIPDLIIWAPGGKTLQIELKAKGGRLSEEQIRFRQIAGLNGHVVHECRSFKKFREIVDGC